MRRDFLLVTFLWMALTAVGEFVAVSWDYQPLKAAKEADPVDHAFYVVVLMAVPLCAFVFAGVTYSMIRFRRRRGLTEDGPPVHINNKVMASWVAITTALTILVIIYPGTIGLHESRDRGHSQGTSSASGNQQMVVEVEGSR